jgi:Amt family ammonium transporter
MEAGDMAWLLISSALVLFMTPGLALFYGGMVRSKNMLNMLMMNVYCLGIVPLLWVVAVFSLLRGEDSGGGAIIGGLDNVFFKDVVGGELLITAAFLLTFACITPALISGAVADRLKFSAWAVFVPVWVLLVYSPLGNWVWGTGGWIKEMGAIDFAGGLVVHISAGASALAFVLALGKRKGWPGEAMPPHNLTFTMIGAGILWFGWFGFNAGSALAANDQAAVAFMNTFIAGAAGMIGWLAIEWVKDGHPTSLGAASGVVAGLVCITPAAGFVGGVAPIVFGLAAGILCYLAIQIKYKAGYDDSLDVVGVHMVGGLIGTLLVGLFADMSAVPGAEFPEGLLFGGGADLLIDQTIAAVAALAYAFGVTFGLVKLIDVTIGLRVDPEVESAGLDRALHGETAYNLIDV